MVKGIWVINGSNMREKKRKITTRDDEQRKEREGTIDEQELQIQFCIFKSRQLMKLASGRLLCTTPITHHPRVIVSRTIMPRWLYYVWKMTVSTYRSITIDPSSASS
jgi:hypothetical protein